MKIAVIGGGGVRSMYLAKSIAQKSERLCIDEVCFMDNNEEKLNIYGKMARHVAFLLAPKMKFTLTLNAVEAVTNADYVITTIRAGGDEMRVTDERIALDMGLLGQETTGAAGLSFAMRSVPALIEYCELIRKYAKKDVKVFNFTNPAGVVSQTLRDMGYDFTYGICDAPSGLLRSFAKMYDAKPDGVQGEIYGLNHLSFFKSITVSGEEMLDRILDDDRTYTDTDMRYFEKQLAKERHAALNEYLYYFYYREKAVENILKAEKTRGETIMEINRNMTNELRGKDIDGDFDECLRIFSKWYGMREMNYMSSETGIVKANEWKFDIYEKDDGGYAGVALKFMEIEKSGEKGTMIMCVPNNGAIKELKDTDVVEITCDVENGKCIPHRMTDLDEQNIELIRRVKMYERLASRAIREKSITAAVEALTMHPLVNSYSLAKRLTEKYLEHNREYTYDWK